MNESTRDRVFISYAHKDLETVLRVVSGLKKRKLSVWLDKENLRPGEWVSQITKEITRSRYFIICISEAALRETGDEPGFKDEELNTAYNIAQVQPDKDFTIIPVRLRDCDRGDLQLTSFQRYDLFPDFETGLDRLAVHLGGISLSDAQAEDERTEEEKLIAALLGKAEAAYYALDYNKAISVWNSVLSINPGDAQAWNNKGSALYNLGRHQDALDAYDKAIEIKPNYAQARLNRGVALGCL